MLTITFVLMRLMAFLCPPKPLIGNTTVYQCHTVTITMINIEYHGIFGGMKSHKFVSIVLS